ncbi:MAG: dihydroorotate dehydrogenase-like protein [Acidobacteriota bacterium]|nr:dihydroorotate dehydrogenase-like protein [Acidobacteriota bacterium]MDQ5837759.1 dihydroorotate dehydrogenase-like protein [Acidobacteriota bacterium]
MDLSTSYMGLRLKNPVVPSASPLSQTLEGIRRMEDAGAGAVVMYSLVEEQINLESLSLNDYLDRGTYSTAEALSYFPEMLGYNGVGPEGYLELVHAAKLACDIPIIGSLNGVSPGGWVEYASLIEQAGADALELNVYFIPSNPLLPGTAVEDLYVEILRDVKRVVSVPLALKLSPYFSNVGHVARRLTDEGADALVLFNRFYQPDFDLENLEVEPRLVLSQSHEIRLPLCWVALLYGELPTDFAVTSGVHNYRDVLKSLMAGAKVAMMASELLQRGVGRIAEVLRAVEGWMEEHEYVSVNQMIGSLSRTNVADPAAFERANYMKMLASYRKNEG